MNIEWSLKNFESLTVEELYAIFRLRIEVFVVEQNCPFQDADNKDQLSYHVTAWRQTQLCAYARIVPPGISYEYPSIGRVVTAPATRHTGLGKLLMRQTIAETEKLFKNIPIRIGAQLYLKTFYESFGFIQTGPVYLEDNIEHIEMTRVARI